MAVPQLKSDMFATTALTDGGSAEPLRPLGDVLGGPVAAMHAAIVERLALDPSRIVFEAPARASVDQALIQPLSHAAGPALLVATVIGLIAYFAF